MVRRNVIQKRSQRLNEYLSILQTLQKYSYAEFNGNPERYGSAERFLQLSIESLNDLGSHLIVDDDLGEVT